MNVEPGTMVVSGSTTSFFGTSRGVQDECIVRSGRRLGEPSGKV